MAAPVIGVNLTLIESADGAGTWGATGGGAASFDSDYRIQGTQSWTKRVSNGTRRLYHEPVTTTVSNDDHLFIWGYATGVISVDTIANGGFAPIIGADPNNYSEYFQGGSDVSLTEGWRCYVASPVFGNPDSTVGNGGLTTPTSVSFIGMRIRTTQAVNGRNGAADVARYGTGLSVSRGEETTNEANFLSVTTENDNTNNQYGVFQETATGAKFQGNLTIGVDDASTDTFFREENQVVEVPDKNPLITESTGVNPNTSKSFTGFDIVGSETVCILNNVSFFTADRYDRGYIDFNSGTNKPKRGEIDGCTFQEWGPTRLSGVTTASNTTWIGCEGIVLNGGTIDNCTIESGITTNGVGAGGTYVLAAGTPENISNTSFICPVGGGGHAFEVTQSGTYSFVGNQFTDANGDAWGFVDTDNAAVHINGGGSAIDVTFNITGGGDGDFTYKLTGAGSTVSFVSAVTVNITGLPVAPTGNATEIRILGAGTTNEIAGVSTENHRSATYSFSLPTGTNFDVRLLNLDYVPAFVANQTASTDPTNIPVDLKLDRVYDDSTPPSGE